MENIQKTTDRAEKKKKPSTLVSILRRKVLRIAAGVGLLAVLSAPSPITDHASKGKDTRPQGNDEGKTSLVDYTKSTEKQSAVSEPLTELEKMSTHDFIASVLDVTESLQFPDSLPDDKKTFRMGYKLDEENDSFVSSPDDRQQFIDVMEKMQGSFKKRTYKKIYFLLEFSFKGERPGGGDVRMEIRFTVDRVGNQGRAIYGVKFIGTDGHAMGDSDSIDIFLNKRFDGSFEEADMGMNLAKNGGRPGARVDLLQASKGDRSGLLEFFTDQVGDFRGLVIPSLLVEDEESKTNKA